MSPEIPAPAASPPFAEPPTSPPEGVGTETPSLETVRHVGDYEILEEIARGGMGVVYKARQTTLQRTVALKMILAGQLASAADVQRFRTEAEAAANLDHPHIVPIYEVGEWRAEGMNSPAPYFSMKFIEGGNLAEAVGSGRWAVGSKEEQQRTARLIAQVARAVHHAHQRGILHRDLKPGNILLDTQGEPHITDFGLAKRVEGGIGQTRTGAIIGTPSYMAPEQARAEKGLTTAVDVYSLGAILYELLTSRPPFRAATPLDTVLQVLDREPERPRAIKPTINRDLETICLKGLEKDPVRRYESAAALADDLERWMNGESIRARPNRWWERVGKWARRKPAAAALIVVIGVAVLSLIGVVTGFTLRLRGALKDTQDQRDIAQAQEQRALNQKVEARRREILARHYWYGADINLAQEALESGNSIRLTQALQRQIPQPGQDDLRGFEWHYLWRQAHGEQRTLQGRIDRVLSLAFSPDGRTLAAAGNHGVELWDLPAGTLRCRIAVEFNGNHPVLAFSPDGRTLATGRGVNEKVSKTPQPLIQLWDPANGKKRSEFKNEFGQVHALAFSPTGNDLTIVFTNPGAAKNLSLWTSLVNPVGLKVMDWNLAEGPRRAISLYTGSFSFTIFGAAVAADGRTLAVAGMAIAGGKLSSSNKEGSKTPFEADQDLIRSRVGVWDLPSGNLRTVLVGSSMISAGVALSPDGRTVASQGLDQQIELWDTRTGKEQTPLLIPDGDPDSILFAPDGKTLAIAGQNRSVTLYKLPDRKASARFFGYSRSVGALAFSPDGKTLAAGDDGGTVKLWDTSRPSGPLPLPPGPFVFTRDGKGLIVAQRNPNWIKSWDVATGKERLDWKGFDSNIKSQRPKQPEVEGLSYLNSLALSPNGHLLAGQSNEATIVWETPTRKELVRLPAANGALCFGNVYFAPDGQTLFTNGDLWDVNTWKKRTSQPLEKWTRFWTFSPDSRTVVISTPVRGTQDTVLELRQLAAGVSSSRTFSNSFIIFVGYSSPDKPLIMTGSKDGTVRIFQTIADPEPVTLTGHTAYVTRAALSPDGKTVATASCDGTVKLWDPETGQERLTLRHEGQLPQKIAFSPDSKNLAVSWSTPDGLLDPAVTTLYQATAKDDHSETMP